MPRQKKSAARKTRVHLRLSYAGCLGLGCLWVGSMLGFIYFLPHRHSLAPFPSSTISTSRATASIFPSSLAKRICTRRTQRIYVVRKSGRQNGLSKPRLGVRRRLERPLPPCVVCLVFVTGERGARDGGGTFRARHSCDVFAAQTFSGKRKSICLCKTYRRRARTRARICVSISFVRVRACRSRDARTFDRKFACRASRCA